MSDNTSMTMTLAHGIINRDVRKMLAKPSVDKRKLHRSIALAMFHATKLSKLVVTAENTLRRGACILRPTVMVGKRSYYINYFVWDSERDALKYSMVHLNQKTVEIIGTPLVVTRHALARIIYRSGVRNLKGAVEELFGAGSYLTSSIIGAATGDINKDGFVPTKNGYAVIKRDNNVKTGAAVVTWITNQQAKDEQIFSGESGLEWLLHVAKEDNVPVIDIVKHYRHSTYLEDIHKSLILQSREFKNLDVKDWTRFCRVWLAEVQEHYEEHGDINVDTESIVGNVLPEYKGHYKTIESLISAF